MVRGRMRMSIRLIMSKCLSVTHVSQVIRVLNKTQRPHWNRRLRPKLDAYRRSRRSNEVCPMSAMSSILLIHSVASSMAAMASSAMATALAQT